MKFLVRNKKTKKVMTKPTTSAMAMKICSHMNALENLFEVISVSEKFAELSTETREMSSDELKAIALLKGVKYNPQTNHAEFANSLLDLASREQKLISEKQSVFLWHIVYHYRRQIGDEGLIQIAKSNKVY